MRPERSIPTSFIASITVECTRSAGAEPPESVSCSGARSLKNASAIWLRPAFWRQRKRTVMASLYQLAGHVEDGAPHPLRQLPRARVLLAGMVRGEQESSLGQRRGSSVPEIRPRLHVGKSQLPPRLPERVERDPPQREPHAHARERGHLADQVFAAVIQLQERRLVVRGRAARGRGDVDIPERQTIVPAKRVRRAGPTLPVELAIEPLPRSVPREHPSRPVGSVRARRQADNEEPGVGVAEARYGTRPVRFPAVRLLPRARDLLAVGSKTRAALARDHVGGDRLDLRGRGHPLPVYHAGSLRIHRTHIQGGSVPRYRILAARALLAVLLLLATPAAHAELTVGTPAPDFTGSKLWI